MLLKSSYFFDFILCRIIYDGLTSFFQLNLENGLDPNYCLSENIEIENHSFSKGSSIIFIVVQCCRFVSSSQNHLTLINLLLNKGVNLKNSPGGGYTSVLDYVCDNEAFILEDIIFTLLKAAPLEFSLKAISYIKDEKKKKEFQKKLLEKESFIPLEEELLFLSEFVVSEEIEGSSYLSVIESNLSQFKDSDICKILLEANVIELRKLLENGLSPDYIITQDVKINNFLCETGSSLLVIALKYSIEMRSLDLLLHVVVLLIEKGASLDKSLLDYIYENESYLSRNIISKLLISTDTSTICMFLGGIKSIQRKRELEIALLKGNDHMDPQNLFVENHYSLDKILSSIEELCLKINSQDFSSLEIILKDAQSLFQYNICLYDRLEETLFSILMIRIENAHLRHKICFLFLQNGLALKNENVVSKGSSVVNFLCDLRAKYCTATAEKFFLLQTICLVLLLLEDSTLVEFVIDRFSILDREKLKAFFFNENELFSKKVVDIKKVLLNTYYTPFINSFIEASLIADKNVLDRNPLDLREIFWCLTRILKALYTCLDTARGRQNCLLSTFEILLIASVHVSVFKVENLSLYYNFWEISLFPSVNVTIKESIVSLIKKYWKDILRIYNI